MRQHESAQHIWNALASVAPNGLDIYELREATGLSFSQIRYGLQYVDDVLQVREGRPRAWHPYRQYYTLSGTWAEHAPYVDVRWKSILTQMKRQESNLTASLVAFGATHGIEISSKLATLRGAIRDIEYAMFGEHDVISV